MDRRRFLSTTIAAPLLALVSRAPVSAAGLGSEIRGALRRLTEAGRGDNRATFMPDGKTLLFASERSGRSQIWAIDRDGEALQLMDRSVTLWRIPVIGRVKGRVLRRLLLRHQPRRGIEVGSLFGYSAILVAGHMPRGGRLVCVLGRPNGKAMLYRLVSGDLSGRPIFDAAAPLLPGFAAPPAFVF